MSKLPLQLLVTQTPEIVLLDGVPCRLWHGTTPDGTPCSVYIHRLQFLTEDGDAIAKLLAEQAIPRAVELVRPVTLHEVFPPHPPAPESVPEQAEPGNGEDLLFGSDAGELVDRLSRPGRRVVVDLESRSIEIDDRDGPWDDDHE